MGDKVKVDPSISEPKYKWGSVKKGSVGTVKRIDSDGDIVVDFPEQSGWKGLLKEMELVSGMSQVYMS